MFKPFGGFDVRLIDCRVLSTPDPHQSHLGEASLKMYFEKEYKQGGVFEHEDYEHDPQDWCWLHKGSGIKARFL